LVSGGNDAPPNQFVGSLSETTFHLSLDRIWNVGSVWRLVMLRFLGRYRAKDRIDILDPAVPLIPRETSGHYLRDLMKRRRTSLLGLTLANCSTFGRLGNATPRDAPSKQLPNSSDGLSAERILMVDALT
jgi:hypothetical protein